MRTYKQLIQEQRYQIEILLKAGNFQHANSTHKCSTQWIIDIKTYFLSI